MNVFLLAVCSPIFRLWVRSVELSRVMGRSLESTECERERAFEGVKYIYIYIYIQVNMSSFIHNFFTLLVYRRPKPLFQDKVSLVCYFSRIFRFVHVPFGSIILKKNLLHVIIAIILLFANFSHQR